jgi:chromosome transmission fidelity protein 18
MLTCAGARRPPCIVLDELDGAAHGSEGHSAVAALVKLVTGAALLAAGAAVFTYVMVLELNAALARLSQQKDQHVKCSQIRLGSWCGRHCAPHCPPHNACAACPAPPAGEGSSKGSKWRAAGGKAAGSARSSSTGGLGVPIICTANDAYAPCLRPLRDIAGVYHVKPPGPEKLMGRLAGIAAAEGLALDRQVRAGLAAAVLCQGGLPYTSWRMRCHSMIRCYRLF